VWLVEPKKSPYGKEFPLVWGLCLLEPYSLYGEGFPEPLEAAQESLNAHLNQRKDNVMLALNSGAIVRRWANVDTESLVNSRPGGITYTDDVEAVQERKIPDVTGSAYLEASEDESMMQEISGVTSTKTGGAGSATKATVAQINLSESNAKIDLYISIVAETYFRSFVRKLAYMIARFETDEKVIRVANDKTFAETGVFSDEYDLKEIAADCVVNVGLGSIGDEATLRQTFLAIDRSIQSNQVNIAMLQQGVAPPGTPIPMINTNILMKRVLEKIGYRDINEIAYFLPAPDQAAEGGGQNVPENGEDLNEQNDLQAGSFGG
jgi:hypothetical protein